MCPSVFGRRLVVLFLSILSLGIGASELRAQSTSIALSTRRGMVFDHAGNHLYISTSTGTVRAYNVATKQFDATYTIGSSLNGIDIAPDDSFLLVAENATGISQGTFYRLNLSDGSVTNINYTKDTRLGEAGAWDVAIGSNGLALVSTVYPGSGWTPLRQIDLTTNAISIRADAPGSGPFNEVRGDTRIVRGADRTRLYLLETDSSDGPAFTYSATTNTFGAPTELDTFTDDAGVGVNRDGTILGTRSNDYPYLGATNTSLDAGANLSFVHGFSGMDAGVAFNAVQDIFYTIGNGGTQIITFDTNTFTELYRINIGETVSGHVTPFGTGNLVASQDGKYLALETSSGIRLINVAGTTVSPSPVFSEPTDMVFDHAGRYLYIATYTGFVWPFNLLSRQFEKPYNVGGSIVGIDIAPDDSFLLLGQYITGISQGAYQKLNLTTAVITNLNYTRTLGEAGGWAVKIMSNGTAFGTNEFAGSGWNPLHQINLTTGVVGVRSDAPGSGGNGEVDNRSQLQRSADGTRLYILEVDASNGPVFTYSAVSDTFGSSAATNTFLDDASAAVNRNGSLLGTRFSGQASAELDSAPAFNFVHSFNGLDSGVAFDAVVDRFYAVNSSTDQILGYNTTNFSLKVTLQIGENVTAGATPFGPGTLVASQDGRYLALQTATTVRVFSIPPTSGPTLQTTRVGRLSNGHFIVQGFATPNSTNTVKATTDLHSTFASIGSVVADLNGVVQFEDTNAGNATSKFYRITNP